MRRWHSDARKVISLELVKVGGHRSEAEANSYKINHIARRDERRAF